MALNWDYIAGFTDGEGYIGVIGRGPRVQWGQKDRAQTEAVKVFLESEGFHPLFYFSARTGNGVYMLTLSRRSEVLRIISQLEPRVILKARACNVVRTWIETHPAKANRDPVDPETFRTLYDKGFTEGAIAERMGYDSQAISKFARRNGFRFKCGGRVIDGIRQEKMTDDEYRKHKATKSRTGKCLDCGTDIYYDSTYCKACVLGHRPKRGHPSLLDVVCYTCGKPVKKLKSQLALYPMSFCSNECKYNVRSVRWSKHHDQCIGCASTESPHIAHGRCNKCHTKWYRQTHPRP